MDKLNAISFMGDRPALWPNRTAEKQLPADIERRLVEALRCVFTDRDLAASLAQECVDLARADGDPGMLALVLYQSAMVLRHAGRPDRAFILCLEAQPLLERFDDRWRASGVILERGLCYLAVGEHDRALDLLGDAAERFDQIEDGAQTARCWTAMAKAHLLGGDLHRAVDCAVRSLAVLDAAGGPPPLRVPPLRVQLRGVEAYLHLMLGHQFAADGDAASCRLEYARAAQALPDLADIAFDNWDPGSALAIDTMIAVHIAAGNAAEAKTAMKALARWARRWNSPVEKAQAWLRLADFRVMQHLPQQAIECARRAARQFENVPLEPGRVAAQLLLARQLENIGDAKGAYEAHREASRIQAQQQQDAIAMRADLLMLDLQAEQELRSSEQTLAYAQRLSNVGHMVASINHELNQPLSSIKMMAETTVALLDIGEQADALANLAVLQRLSGRLVDLASKLAAFPVQSTAEPRCVGLRHAVEEALAMLGSRLAQSDCEVVRMQGDVQVQAAESQLVRVIANLLNNALDAMAAAAPGAPRRIVIATQQEAGRVLLRLADSGPGMSDKVRERLFQPFFSTKPAGQGLGLGLALSRDVVREMGGDLTAANGSDGGAVFTISLKRADATG
jgi:signal transduction histidine kinase